jgi:DNA-3-methyladenine glycosylase II
MTTLASQTFTIEPRGPFSLREAALFGFGPRHDDAFDGTMRMAFCADGYTSQAAVAVTQDHDGTVRLTLTGGRGGPDPATVAAQVARVLSLDRDAWGFVALGEEDPVIAGLLEAAPGLRPPLFSSPYEAAFWSVLSARRNRRAAETWRRRIARAHGCGFEVAGTTLWALPLPAAILGEGPEALVRAAGIEDVRAERLYGVAAAAWEGSLDAGRLSAMDPDTAREQLRRVPGIGAFSADLVLLRATGATDVLPVNEARMLGLMGELWGLGAPATPEWAAARSQAWSPWRTWVAVLVRAAGPRVLGLTRRAVVA